MTRVPLLTTKGYLMPIIEDKRLTLAVKTVVEQDFKNASDRFFETRGGTDAWADLEEAMWALQALGSPELIKDMEQVGIGHWTSTLASRHRTKQP